MLVLTRQGSLAYIGSEKAIADLPLFNGNIASGGGAAYLFWRSAYLVSAGGKRERCDRITGRSRRAAVEGVQMMLGRSLGT